MPQAINEPKPGIATTEFWGKSAIQMLLLVAMIFNLDVEITDAQVLSIVGGLEAAYTVGRSITKRPVT